MDLRNLKIAVAGAGIGGLACALALRKQGATVTVLEQAEAITEVGAGIQVSPNGVRVMEALGLADELAACSLRAEAVSLRDFRKGRTVAHLDLSALPEDQKYYFVHRADMIDLLATAVRKAGAKVRLLQKVTNIHPGKVPRIDLAHGDHLCCDLVIGADGLHSVLRPVLNEPRTPFFTGQVAWRAIVPNKAGHPPHACVHMGPGRHIVSYPLRDGKSLNLVAVQERSKWAAEGWNHLDQPENLSAAFADFSPEVREMLAQADAPALWGLFRHPVADCWHGDGCALLGDAAHPTLPFMAQGANMALEDAWALSDALASCRSLTDALENYQLKRHARVKRVVDAATGNAWKYHLRPGPVRMAAHLGLGVLSRIAPGRLLHQFDWLYGYDVTQASSSTQIGT